MRKLLQLTFIIVLFASCAKDREFPSGTFKTAAAPIVGTRQLIHYWNFNNVTDLLTPSLTIGNASWIYSTSAGGYYDAVADSSSLNARNGDIGGSALRLRNPAGSFVLNLPTSGYKNVIFSYAVKRTSNGAQLNSLSYSVDGINFSSNNLQPNLNNVDTIWNVYSYDFSGITAVNDNSNFKIKIDFAIGSGNSSGNDRFDNITVDADSIPGSGLNNIYLLNYWNFNNSDTSKAISLIPAASLDFDFATVTGTTGYFDFTTSTATQNVRNGDLPGDCLRVRNPVNAFIINTPTTGYKKIKISYAVDRTSSGAQNSDVSYSLNGGTTYINTGLTSPTYMPTVDPNYSLITYDLSSISGANNNPNLRFKITFSNGNLGTSGNNRFDNITVEGYKQ